MTLDMIRDSSRTRHLDYSGLVNSGSTWIRAVAAIFVAFVVIPLPVTVEANHDARRLYDDLLRKNYNKLVRPVANISSKLTVKLGLKLSQIDDVDEKNEILATNMWLSHEWTDDSLIWDPAEYGGVEMIHVPPEMIWRPDIVLYNNADGDYTVTLMTKATLTYGGTVLWDPPVLFKSRCDINVLYFPLDEQVCLLKFGSWSYDGDKVDLRHKDREKYGSDELITIVEAIDLTDYYESVEWDLMDVPAKKNIKYYPCCVEPYPDVTFTITIRRKTLYYAYTLIIPCVSINMLTVLSFYLPCECGEKVPICITILLSLSLFQLLLMDLVPATSTNMSMLGNYLLLTCTLVSLSVFFSVVMINVSHRSKDTTRMPTCIRYVFLEVLPRLLLMRKPKHEDGDEDGTENVEFSTGNSSDLANYANPYKKKFERRASSAMSGANHEPRVPFLGRISRGGDFCEACAIRRMKSYGPNIQKGLEGIAFIAKHTQDDDENKKVAEEWKYTGMVVNRIILWIYITICFVGALGILLNAPVLRDDRQALKSRANTKVPLG